MQTPDQKTLERLELYRAGALSGAERDEVERRVREDPEWAALHDELGAHDSLARSLGVLEVRSDPTRLTSLDGLKDLELLHRGGQGIVYRAHEVDTDRTVAVKVMLAGADASERERLRFTREVEVAAQLQHPNIVAVFHRGATARGEPFFVMPLVEGRRLDVYVREERLVTKDVLRLFLKVARAVHYAHQRGVLHRDLKPSNVLVDDRGDPHVLDFGLAKPLAGSPNDSVEDGLTQTGEFAGTLGYAAPEQLSGNPERVEVRSDIYALGVLLYGLLTDRHPFRGDGSLPELIDAILHKDPPSPSSVRSDLDVDLDVIVTTAMAREIERRYATVEHFVRDIDLYLSGRPIEAKSDHRWYVLRKTVSRYRLASSVLIGVTLVLLAATVVSTRFWRDAERARAAAVLAQVDVEKKRAEAVLERDRATRETQARRTVGDFVWSVLSAVQGQPAGREVSVVDALVYGASRIERRASAESLARVLLHEQFGGAFFLLGRLGEAEQHFTLALELAERGEHLTADESWNLRRNLAVVLAAQGRSLESERLFSDCLAWLDRNPHATSPSRATVERGLGFLLLEREALDQAEPLLARAFESLREERGPGNVEALDAQRAWGLCLLKRGRIDEGMSVAEDAFEKVRTLHPNQRRDVINARNVVAFGAQARFDHARSIALLEESAEECRSLGPLEIVAPTTWNNLGGAYRLAGRTSDAEVAFREALVRLGASFGSEHPKTLLTNANLGQTLSALGRHDEALACLRAVAEAMERTLGPEHPDTLNAYSSIAWALGAAGRYEEGIGAYDDMIARIDGGTGGPGPWFRDYTRANQTYLMIKAGRVDEALPILRESSGNLRRILGEQDRRVIGVGNLLRKLERSLTVDADE